MNTKLNLSERNKDLLLMGAKTTGSFTEGYHYVYESLYIDEADSLYAFCEWIENKIGGAGPINIQDLWYSFNHPEEQFSKNVAKHWKEQMDKILSQDIFIAQPPAARKPNGFDSRYDIS